MSYRHQTALYLVVEIAKRDDGTAEDGGLALEILVLVASNRGGSVGLEGRELHQG